MCPECKDLNEDDCNMCLACAMGLAEDGDECPDETVCGPCEKCGECMVPHLPC